VNIVVIPENFAIFNQGSTSDSFIYSSDGKEPMTGIGFSQDGAYLHISVARGTVMNTYSVARR